MGNLISADGRSLNLLAYLSYRRTTPANMSRASTSAAAALVEGVRAVTAKWNRRLPEPIRVSGIPHITITLFENMRHDLIVFGIASLLLFTLAFCGRLPAAALRGRSRSSAACCPAVVMVGAMACFGIPLGFVTSNMPVLLFVLMLPYNVYFIERYRERRARHPDEDGLD